MEDAVEGVAAAGGTACHGVSGKMIIMYMNGACQHASKHEAG